LLDSDYTDIVDRESWDLLAKLHQTGRMLPAEGVSRLKELESRHPEWRLSDGSQRDFTPRMTLAWGEPPLEGLEEFISAHDDQVKDRLAKLADGDLRRWRHLVEVNPDRAVAILNNLAAEDMWPPRPWETAIQDLTGNKPATQWPGLAELLNQAPDELITYVNRQLSWALMKAGESSNIDDKVYFWELWDRVQPHAYAIQPEDPRDPVSAALNSSAGNLAGALLSQVAYMKPKSRADLPDQIWRRLTLLADGASTAFLLARVLLASRLAWLHSLHPEWVETKLIPRFDFDASSEAPAVWQGFLYNPGITPELWPPLKPFFLQAVGQAQRLGKGSTAISHLLAIISVKQPDWLTDDEVRPIIRAFDAKSRARVAETLASILGAAGEGGTALWTKQIGPWLDRNWPKDLALRDADTSLQLAKAAASSGGSFTSAVDQIVTLLVPSEQADAVWPLLLRANLPSQEPVSTLKLVDAIYCDSYLWPSSKLRQVLDGIQLADPGLTKDARFRQLDEYLQKHNR